MNAMNALLKREFLEHRGAFLYAPLVILTLVTLFTIYGASTGQIGPDDEIPRLPGTVIYQVAVAAVFAAWSAYLLIALFFYFADSFSADRRNNALLFWKSMPQSDFKILGSKALAGGTVFPVMIAAYAALTAAIAYVVVIILALRMPIATAPNIAEAMGTWVQMSIAGVVMLVLTVLWYAPFLAWVAGLSTLFKGWSIPLAFLIPGVIGLLENVGNYGRAQEFKPVSNYLAWRIDSPFMGKEEDGLELLLSDNAAWQLIGEMLVNINWPQMALGLAFTVAVVYGASEIRRRRIEA